MERNANYSTNLVNFWLFLRHKIEHKKNRRWIICEHIFKNFDEMETLDFLASVVILDYH